MYKFDSKRKILTLSKHPLDEVPNSYENSYHYDSYNKYLNNGLLNDINTQLIPSMNNILQNTQISPVTEINLSQEKSNGEHINYINMSFTLSNFNDFNSILTSNKKTPDFNFLQLPYMDKSGIISRGGNKYTFLGSLQIDNSITFEQGKNVLSIVDVDNSFTIKQEGLSEPKFIVFRESVPMIDLMTMLAKEQYKTSTTAIDYSKRIIYAIRNNELDSKITGTQSLAKQEGEQAKEQNILYRLSLLNDQMADNFGFLEKMEYGIFNTKKTREYINELCSFKHSIGRIISRDIISYDDKIIIPQGTLITQNVINTLEENRIDIIHVEADANLLGYILAQNIQIDGPFLKGTPVIQELIDEFPNLKGYTEIPETIDKDVFIIIAKNSQITQELSDFLRYLGKRDIKYKSSIKSSKILIANFEEEYINNRHFLNNTTSETFERVYVDLDGNVYDTSDKLTCHDVAALLSIYLKLKSGKHHELVSDKDIGLRKRVDLAGDFLHKAFKHATKKFVKFKSRTLLSNNSVLSDISDFYNMDRMNMHFYNFEKYMWDYMYHELKCIDILDLTNPIATVSSLTKINTILSDSRSASDDMRNLTLYHYGRICPYESPQSTKLGIVNNKAIGCKIVDGIMKASYYKLVKSSNGIFLSKEITYLSQVEEEDFRISDISNVDVNWETREVTVNTNIPAKIPMYNSIEKVALANIPLEYVEYVSISPNQHCSYTSTVIPFAGSDDPVRVSFGDSMIKQSKGLVMGEKPIVSTTGFYTIPRYSTMYMIFAEDDGVVRGVGPNYIAIQYNNKEKPVTYEFEPQIINAGSIILKVTIVLIGDKVIKGQTVVTSNFIKDDSMNNGINALIAILPDGYNYEDGVLVSKNLSQKLTSYGTHYDTYPISKNYRIPHMTDIKNNVYVDKDDDTNNLLCRINVQGQRLEDGYKKIDARASKCKGFISDVSLVYDRVNKSNVKEVKISSVSFDSLNNSDKTCNRHGNKGVTCKVKKNSEMLYFENGEFIDMEYNPAGIISRMNIGQLIELKAGLCGYVLGIQILLDSFNSPSSESILDLLSYTVDLANSDDIEKVIVSYPHLPKELHEHCKDNIDSIRHWRGSFDKYGKAYLIDPKSGNRSHEKIDIGINYIYKLVQEGEGKLHARGGLLTSNYVYKTGAPTKGSSRGGGQKYGHMEIDSVQAYGSAAYLHEIMNARGDNVIERNNLTVDYLHDRSSAFKISEKYSIRHSIIQMMQYLRAMGIYVEFTENELDLTSITERKIPTIRALKESVIEEENSEQIRLNKNLEDVLKKELYI